MIRKLQTRRLIRMLNISHVITMNLRDFIPSPRKYIVYKITIYPLITAEVNNLQMLFFHSGELTHNCDIVHKMMKQYAQFHIVCYPTDCRGISPCTEPSPWVDDSC